LQVWADAADWGTFSWSCTGLVVGFTSFFLVIGPARTYPSGTHRTVNNSILLCGSFEELV
jgi:hypothetical protein